MMKPGSITPQMWGGAVFTDSTEVDSIPLFGSAQLCYRYHISVQNAGISTCNPCNWNYTAFPRSNEYLGSIVYFSGLSFSHGVVRM
jgi:hypothetical protein